ncbi:MAG TPA: integrase arm-type DNA-binding domain-containing protein [Xanthobacteraceae bacterium]|jgi:integrase|nr:integrase arm-type DNA-binding domain-containing protein [Xanthobacteraceae bacterium]
MTGGRLKALEVTKLKNPGMYGDGGGLYLQIAKGGSKSWIFRYRFKGHTSKAGRPLAREMGLGSAGTFTLAEARERAREKRQLLADGIDPIEQRKSQEMAATLAKAQMVPFQDCAKEYIKAHRSGWKSEKHAKQWTSTLETWVYPIIGSLAVSGITTDLVLKILEQPISDELDAPTFWTARTETANRVRGRVETILDWAKARKLRDGENPARWKGLLDKLLPARSKVSPVLHHKALPYSDIPRFMAELRKRDSLSARALEYTILTAARTNDTIDADRTEIDKGNRLWTVPAPRLKGKKGARQRDHVVPLSDRAMQILDEPPQTSSYLFAHDDGEPLSNMAMLELLQGMGFGEDLTVHGFRSTFKDWCSEQTAYPNEMSEIALAHTVEDKVEAAYRRGDMREKRRRLMADWAAYCESTPAETKSNVVTLRA